MEILRKTRALIILYRSKNQRSKAKILKGLRKTQKPVKLKRLKIGLILNQIKWLPNDGYLIFYLYQIIKKTKNIKKVNHFR
jgi:hypothetical protein